MNLEERQRERQERILADSKAAVAEAEKVLARAKHFFNNEGQELKRSLDLLSPQVRQEIEQAVSEKMAEIKQEVELEAQRKVMEQDRQHRPRSSRKLV